MPQPLHLAIGQLATSMPERMVIALGPEHPSRTGVLLVDAEIDEGVVTAARVQPGFNHRGAEKLFEVRDYRQVLVLADRHDWQAPFTGELGVALVCEHLMGLVPPPRATWLRTLLAEHARIASHLAHLSFVAHRNADAELGASIHAVRERARELSLAVSGNRVHPMLNRLGGLATDIDAHWVAQFVAWAQDCAEVAGAVAASLRNTGLGRGVAPISRATIDGFGLGGPVAQASGLPRDLRVGSDYLAYPELTEWINPQLAVCDGDAASRFHALAAQVASSAEVMAACAERLQGLDGPVDTKLSKMVKLPDAEAWLTIEAPWGPAGFWLVSRAERTPWRLRLRTPSFANVQALEVALVGCPVAELDVAVASLGWTAGDLDK